VAARTSSIKHRTSNRCSSPTRRGSVLIAVIITLIVVQIVVLGVVALGARDQSLTKLRLESEQAQYAAESGINMALKEVYDSADQDTDGTIGSISAKTVNGCSVVVTTSTAGAITTLTSTATATTAKRVVVVKYSG
jgi:Tfp pilus assembly protein PilX